jgi:DNA polymerase-3 subunit delta
VILVSDDLSPRDALRKWAEADQAAAALPCYQDDGWSLEKLINETLRGYGLRAGKDVLTWMTHNLGGDRMIILSELEKLSLYMGDRDMVEPADVLAVTDSTRDRQLSELCEAIASRQPVTAMRIYDRLHAEDVQSIAMVRSLSTYFMRLKHLRESVDNGMSPADAVKGYRPPVFFKQQPLLTQQVNSWNMAEIDAFLSLMFEAEIALKSTVSGLDIWLPQTLLLQMQKPRAA